jgi:hypothetical protein
MSSPATGLRLASLLFAIFASGHTIRLIGHFQVTVDAIQIPMWVSVIALIVGGFLSIWFWRLSARA